VKSNQESCSHNRGRLTNQSNRPDIPAAVNDGIIYSSIPIDRNTNPMFVVLLKFSSNKDQAGRYMEGHKAWIKRGFDDGVFVLAGSLESGAGGGIVAHNTSLSALQVRVNADPFVSEGVVSSEIIEITPSRLEERLEFLLD